MISSWLWIACLLVTHAGPGEPTLPARAWVVIVRPIRADTIGNERLYWVGLQNDTATPRAFCVLGVRYKYDLQDGSSVDQPTTEYPTVGSPHPCASQMGHLVLPGETYFVKVRVPPLENAAKDGKIQFWITAEETCGFEEACRHSPIIALEPTGGTR